MAKVQISFRIGDVLPPDDDVAIWISTIALAHNDLVTTHVLADEAKEEWRRFYYWRVGVGHYSEIVLFLERWQSRPAIQNFIAASPGELQATKARSTSMTEIDASRSTSVTRRSSTTRTTRA